MGSFTAWIRRLAWRRKVPLDRPADVVRCSVAGWRADHRASFAAGQARALAVLRALRRLARRDQEHADEQ